MELKLKKPEYNNEVIIELDGDYNDGDYVNTTLSVSVEVYKIIFPILRRLTDHHNWERNNIYDLFEEALKNLAIREDDSLYEDVMEAADDLRLRDSEGNECHTMYINSVYFQSKEDSIRYMVEFMQ